MVKQTLTKLPPLWILSGQLRIPLTLLMACIVLTLGSCDAFPGMVENPDPQQTMSPISPTEPPSSPTPGPELEVLSLSLLPGENPDAGQVIAKIINEGETPLGDIEVTFTFHGQDRGVLDTITARSIPSNLLPSEEALVAFTYDGILAGNDISVEFHAEKIDQVHRAQSEIEGATWNLTPEGTTVILGQITNRSFSQVKLLDLAVLLLDEEQEPLGYAARTASMTHIPPRDSSTFSAAAVGSYEPDELEFFVDLVIDSTPPEPDLRFQDQPVLQFSDQGVPFFLGSIYNPSPQWVWSSGLINLESDGQLVGIATIDPPLPVQPEGIISFSIQQFWGLSAEILASEEAMRSLEVHPSVEGISSLAAGEKVSQLMVSVSQYEAFRSLVFLHGDVANDLDSPVQTPSVFVTARDHNGLLITAGWVSPVDALAPGEGSEFEISLILPDDVDPAMLEFDVIAFGIATKGTNSP